VTRFFKGRKLLTVLAVVTMFVGGVIASLQPPAHKGKRYTDRFVSTYPVYTTAE